MGSRVVTTQPDKNIDDGLISTASDPAKERPVTTDVPSPEKNFVLAGDGRSNLPSPLISVYGLEFGYEGQPRLLSSLDFTLYPGEKVGLLGPNGSGKTTFLHILMGLISPLAGTIEIFGRPRRHPKDFRDLPGQIGLLFQDSDDQLFCPTVAEDVAFGPFNQGKSAHEVRQIVRHTLAKLGLAGWETRITYRLSGGEKRLVALATVLAMDPQILLLDEPTAGLDEKACLRVEMILSELPQAMIIVSHDQAFLRRVCDRAMILKNGTLEPIVP